MRRNVPSSGTGKWTAAFVGLLAFAGVAVHFLASTPYAGTVAQVSLATMIGALLPCAFLRAASFGALLFLVAGFGLIVGVIAYLAHGPYSPPGDAPAPTLPQNGCRL